jgi:hypothetical protein
MKFPKKITLARIAAHDFNRSLRVWKTRISDTEILRLLVNERARALALFVRNLGITMIGTLWLSTAKSTLELRLTVIDVTIPVAYVNFVVAALIFGTVVHVINYLTLNEFVRIASNKLFKFDAPWVLTALQDGGNVWSIGTISQFRFFKSSPSHNRIGKAISLLTNIPFLAMIIAAYWIVLSVGVRVIHNDGILSSSSAFTFIAWLLIGYPLAYIIIFLIPFSFSRNTRFVRWNFLTKMYRRVGLWPPRVNAWLADQNREQSSASTKAQTRREQIEAENEARTAELRKKYSQQ